MDNVVVRDIGPASAYALAVKYGFVGTEEEWATTQIEAGNNAISAANSASAAAGSAASAGNSATAAAESAQEAKEAAGSVSYPVSYVEQTLTSAQKSQARENIGAIGETDIVQTAGDSETAVMSQKAVTERFKVSTKDVVTSINKFDNVFDETGYINISTGEDADSDRYHRTSKFYPLDFTTDTLTIKLSNTDATSYTVLFYNANKEYTGKRLTCAGELVTTYSALGNCVYFRVYKDIDAKTDAIISMDVVTDDTPYDYVVQIQFGGNEVDEYIDNRILLHEQNAPLDKVRKTKNVLTAELFDLGNRSNAYYVGEGKEFATINAALSQWRTDGSAPSTIYIANGEYNEKVDVEDANLHFIGESREGVLIRTKTGNYSDAPIMIHHGNVRIENMTVVADHSDNADFTYEGGASTRAYAVHIDGGSVGGKVVCKNITAISYQSPAFGMGTIPNSTIRLENCKAISLTDADAAGSSLKYGAILCHNSSNDRYPDRGAERLELVDVSAYSENTETGLYLSRSTEETFYLLAINTVFANGINDEIGNAVKTSTNVNFADYIELDDDSHENTEKILNYDSE